MGPVEFAARYIASRNLPHLDYKGRKRLILQYMEDRRELETETARQLLREACDKEEKTVSTVPNGWESI